MLPHAVSFPAYVRPSDIDRTFTFDKANYLRYRIFRGHRYHHMYMIRHRMPLFYVALFLTGQTMKNLSEIFT